MGQEKEQEREQKIAGLSVEIIATGNGPLIKVGRRVCSSAAQLWALVQTTAKRAQASLNGAAQFLPSAEATADAIRRGVPVTRYKPGETGKAAAARIRRARPFSDAQLNDLLEELGIDFDDNSVEF